jgi:hypothetical protein
MSFIFKTIFSIFDALAWILFLGKNPPRVVSGPFVGMLYGRKSCGSSLVPKILGTYECELHCFIKDLKKFELGLDVGAAEGYYAVGLLYAGVCDRVIAWEISEEGRNLSQELAVNNKVAERMEMRGECSLENLAQTIRQSVASECLLIIDCEGYESVLIEGLKREELAKCWLIIETHDFVKQGIHNRIKSQLENTHVVTEIFPAKRTSADMPANLQWPQRILKNKFLGRLAMSERRPAANGWLCCKPLIAPMS